MPSTPKPSFLLDTGPLSVLCGFPISDTPYIHQVLAYATMVLPDAVVGEIGSAGKMVRVISPLLKAAQVVSLPTPAAPAILDTAYSGSLGSGERATIKCGLATGLPVVIDDQDAFIVACRFGLRPIIFQDFMVGLAREHGMPKETALEIVRTTARQFPATYLAHTVEMLS